MKVLLIVLVALISLPSHSGVFSTEDLQRFTDLMREHGINARYFPRSSRYRERVEITRINSCRLDRMYLDNNDGFLLLVRPDHGGVFFANGISEWTIAPRIPLSGSQIGQAASWVAQAGAFHVISQVATGIAATEYFLYALPMIALGTAAASLGWSDDPNETGRWLAMDSRRRRGVNLSSDLIQRILSTVRRGDMERAALQIGHLLNICDGNGRSVDENAIMETLSDIFDGARDRSAPDIAESSSNSEARSSQE